MRSATSLILAAYAGTAAAVCNYPFSAVVNTNNSFVSQDPTVGQAAPTTVPNYVCYGAQPKNFPAFSKWLSFDNMWAWNYNDISSNNAGDVSLVTDIRQAVLSTAAAVNVDPRLVLAIMLQESGGQASVVCTGPTATCRGNCGLLQAPYGSTKFDTSDVLASVLSMVEQGVRGTITGGVTVGPNGDTGQCVSGYPGLVQYYTNNSITAGTPGGNALPGNPYVAARAYNTGYYKTGDKLTVGSTNSYANDVANRLLGWRYSTTSSFATTNCANAA